MQALCWHDTGDVRIDTVPDPKIIESRDAIVKVTTTAMCGAERLDRYANLLQLHGYPILFGAVEITDDVPACGTRTVSVQSVT